ncbi:hypothetical protein CRG98_012749 [Punica granatum]|uniref:Uncharacterized protein n=1 Tax=Punica granatum TaxID=22663 RepID=A0A2I0KFC1_PUNGR|nr:hypothetical protein CRG98_012749 [Punica granatum]
MAEEQQLAIYEEDAPPTPAHSPSQGTHVIPPATPTTAATYLGAPSMPFPPPTVQTASNVIDPVRFTALEGMVNQLAANMNTNMAELITMLRDHNRASSSYTPPPEHGTIVDPNPVVPPIYVTDSEEMSLSTMTYVPAVHPVSDPIPPPPAPTSVALPPAAFLSVDSAIHTLPLLTITAQPPTYTVPPLTAAPAALPTNIPPNAENEQERRIRRIEETIRALQAEVPRPVSILREDTPTLLELSTKEMKENQAFEAYAAEWRGKAAKHIPPITERQQVQLFHSTLRGAYYSHLLAHTSLFSDLIEAGKKLDMGIKLGRIEGLTKKKEEEAPKRHTASTSKRAKDVTVNAVNPGRQSPQQFSMNYTPPPPVHKPMHILYNTRRPIKHIRHIIRLHRSLFSHRRHNNTPRLKAEPRLQDLLSRHSGATLPHCTRGSNTHPCRRLYPTYTSSSWQATRSNRRHLTPISIQHIGAIGEDKDAQETPVPFIIEHVPAKIAVASAPFVIEVPAKEPYQDSRVPWSYGDSVANAEQELSAMGITRSGRV